MTDFWGRTLSSRCVARKRVMHDQVLLDDLAFSPSRCSGSPQGPLGHDLSDREVALDDLSKPRESRTVRFTDRWLSALEAPETGSIEYFDAHRNCPAGFGLRVFASPRRGFPHQAQPKPRLLLLGGLFCTRGLPGCGSPGDD